MATGIGLGPPPPIWIDPRSRVELFDNPTSVEVYVAQQWQLKESARLALAKSWKPGLEDDRTALSGKFRIYVPTSGLYVFVCRGRGKLSGVRVDGQQVYPSWQGLDSLTAPPYGTPKGWHPFVFEWYVSTTIEFDLTGFRMSALSYRPAFASTDDGGGGDNGGGGSS